jgi:hypothetical protein
MVVQPNHPILESGLTDELERMPGVGVHEKRLTGAQDDWADSDIVFVD